MVKKLWLAMGAALLMLAAMVGVALALPGPTTIDGNISDWSDATCYNDPGGVDDETSPQRADITRFCAYVDSGYLYILMAWDDTLPGGSGSSAGVRVDINADGVYDYLILDTISSSGSTLTANKARVQSCTLGDCTNGGSICDETQTPTCSSLGVLEAVNNTSPDPFSHTGNCAGTSCTTLDAFVEMAIPWTVFGLSAPPSPQVFGNYGSYPSGPAQAPKDVTGANGLSCTPSGNCYVSTPTAIKLLSSEAVAAKGSLSLLLVALLTVVTLWVARKR